LSLEDTKLQRSLFLQYRIRNVSFEKNAKDNHGLVIIKFLTQLGRKNSYCNQSNSEKSTLISRTSDEIRFIEFRPSVGLCVTDKVKGKRRR